ncbi:MAG: TetR/AcrR family transcriptional regulator [Pseudomonadota bacterium]
MKTKTPAQKTATPAVPRKVGRPPRAGTPPDAAAPEALPSPKDKDTKPDLQPSDWVRAGMKILAQSGVDMVLIPPLAKALGVTKGSFYWHFASRDELLMKLIEEWRQHATLRVIDIVERAGVSAQEKIRLIAFIGTNSPIDEFGGAVELAVRNWARVNPTVRKVVADVDRQRLNYLTQLYQELGSTVDPELLACLHYCFSSGLRLLFAYPEKQKLALRQAALEQIFFAGVSSAGNEKKGD